MAGDKAQDRSEKVPPPDGAKGHNRLEDAAAEALRDLERRRDGGGHAGAGDIG